MTDKTYIVLTSDNVQLRASNKRAAFKLAREASADGWIGMNTRVIGPDGDVVASWRREQGRARPVRLSV